MPRKLAASAHLRPPKNEGQILLIKLRIRKALAGFAKEFQASEEKRPDIRTGSEFRRTGFPSVVMKKQDGSFGVRLQLEMKGGADPFFPGFEAKPFYFAVGPELFYFHFREKTRPEGEAGRAAHFGFC